MQWVDQPHGIPREDTTTSRTVRHLSSSPCIRTRRGELFSMASPEPSQADPPVSVGLAAALASSAFVVPLALSASSTPSPNDPRIFSWYRLLKKPGFKPPDWVIPVAWFGIEGSLAVAAYRLLRSPATPARRNALALGSWNIFMIGAWSRLFFKRHDLALSTVAAASMVATGVEFARQAKRADPVAARAAVPLIVWVSFATALTATIWALNRRRN